MADLDQDLISIQEARNLASRAFIAWTEWSKASQQDVDRVCAAMAAAAFNAADRLAQLAHDETGFGHASHKRLKNEFAAQNVWQSIRDVKTVGVIQHDVEKKLYQIAWPVGVDAGLTPSTNPTSNVI